MIGGATDRCIMLSLGVVSRGTRACDRTIAHVPDHDDTVVYPLSSLRSQVLSSACRCGTHPSLASETKREAGIAAM